MKWTRAQLESALATAKESMLIDPTTRSKEVAEDLTRQLSEVEDGKH